MNLNLSNLKENSTLLLWIFLGYFLGMVITKSENPYFFLISLSLPLSLILFTYHEICFYIIIFSVFFADWFKELGLIPEQITWLPDAILLLLAAKVTILKVAKEKDLIGTAIIVPLIAFILLGLISMLVNSNHIITVVLGFRPDLKFVLMFLILVNLNLEEKFLRQMILVLIILLVIQVPVSLVKLSVYGQGESAIGTYGVHGGTHSTILPLLGISIFIGFFLFEKQRPRYIFFCLLFVLFSIVGGKRAFVFFGVLLFLFMLWQAGRKNLGKFSLVVPFLIPAFLSCIYFVPSLRPAFKNPRHLIDFPVSYSTAYTRDTRKAGGRASAMKETYRLLKKNPTNFLLGFGPGSFSKSYFSEFEGNFRNKVAIAYGRSQWVTMSLEYGYAGALLFLWLLIPLFKANQIFFDEINDDYWKAISFGFKGFCFVYLMGFFYGKVFRIDVLAFLFWFFSGIIYCMGKKKKLF